MGNKLFKKKEPIIQVIGPYGAGKTTLVMRLADFDIENYVMPNGIIVQTLDVKNVKIVTYEFGSRDDMRPMSRHLFPQTVGYIYVVDSSERERVDEDMDEFIKDVLLEEGTYGGVVMVMANKQDVPGAMTAAELEQMLKEKYTFSSKSSARHTVLVRPCSALTREGLTEAFGEFAEQIALKANGKSRTGLIPLDEKHEKEGKVAERGSDATANKTENYSSTAGNDEGVKESTALKKIKAFQKNPFVCIRSLFE